MIRRLVGRSLVGFATGATMVLMAFVAIMIGVGALGGAMIAKANKLTEEPHDRTR